MAPATVTLGALLPRVLRRGTRRWPDLANLSGHLEDLYGASLGATASKLGDRRVIEASFSAAGPAHWRGLGRAEASSRPGAAGGERPGPGKDAPLAVQGAALLAEVLADPSPPEEGGRSGLRSDYVREEKDALARDIAAISDDRGAYANWRCLAEMCRGEPNAFHSLGRAEDLEAINPQALDAFRRRLLASAPFVAYLAGPVDDTVAGKVAHVLGDFVKECGDSLREDVPRSLPHPRPKGEAEILEPADVEQARLVVGLQTGITLEQEEHPAQVLYNGLLGGFVHSRLFRRIREEAGLAYYAWSRVIPTKGVILISSGIQERNYGKAVDLVRQEIAALGRGEFTDAEFEATRNSALAVAKGQLDSPGALIYGHLERLSAGEVVEEIAPWRRLEAVTAEQVRQFAARPVIDTIYLLGRLEQVH